ncbi:MAG: hypothetical protein V1761_04520, partial [bacterium]
MKLKRLIKPLITIFVAVGAFIMVFSNPFSRSDYDQWKTEITDEMYAEALAVIKGSTNYITRRDYIGFLENNAITYGLIDADATLLTGAAAADFGYEGVKAADLGVERTATYTVDVPNAGLYYIRVDYYVGGAALNNLTVAVRVNGEYPYDDAETIDVPLVWTDASKTFVLDTYGDESLPEQERVVGWRPMFLFNNTYTTTEPLLFLLAEGENLIEI